MQDANHKPFNGAALLELYQACRQYSLQLCEGLSDEDIQAQSMPDASPLKWHLAHTSWAFETFILKDLVVEYQPFDTQFEYLFNSYYNAIGKQFPRAQRGLLTRPNRKTIIQYRAHVDKAMQSFLTTFLGKFSLALTDTVDTADERKDVFNLVLLLINHEQQHQELMLTDLKHLLFIDPGFPQHRNLETLESCQPSETIEYDGGICKIGHRNETFFFDNEGPLHEYYLVPFKMDSHLVSNAEYLEFVLDGGYKNSAFWLSEAWQNIQQNRHMSPYYWMHRDKQWFEYTLSGLKPLDPTQPVKHVNYFEASAYASWRGKRLPTEQEWEMAARSAVTEQKQMFGQLWQWTSSSYNAYPGFKPVDGAIGEYNGKFMVNQYVLRGGSIATPPGHIRPSYRNFFYPGASWQFSGIRLAETI